MCLSNRDSDMVVGYESLTIADTDQIQIQLKNQNVPKKNPKSILPSNRALKRPFDLNAIKVVAQNQNCQQLSLYFANERHLIRIRSPLTEFLREILCYLLMGAALFFYGYPVFILVYCSDVKRVEEFYQNT